VKKAMNSRFVKRAAMGAVITAAALSAGSAVAVPAMASTDCYSGCPSTGTWTGTGTGTGTPTGTFHRMPGVRGFGQVAAAPVAVRSPVNQIVGTIGAPLVNVNVPCPAPWWQGGLLGAKYNACSTAVVDQQDGPSFGYDGAQGHGVSGFGQVAAAPVQVDAPVNQLVGTVGAPLVNVNIPCPAAWNQGGLLGAKYNACNTAPVNQSDVSGGLLG
jgi:hypothetical protein